MPASLFLGKRHTLCTDEMLLIVQYRETDSNGFVANGEYLSKKHGFELFKEMEYRIDNEFDISFRITYFEIQFARSRR